MEKSNFERAKEIEKLNKSIDQDLNSIDRILKGYNHEKSSVDTINWFNRSDEGSYNTRVYNASSYQDVLLSKSTIETALFLERSKLMNERESLNREFESL